MAMSKSFINMSSSWKNWPVLLISLMTVSCISPKNVLYLQDMDTSSQIQLENKFEAVVSPFDELTILVSCYDEELSKPFNVLTGGTVSQTGNIDNSSGYLVDVNGDINFPVLGRLHIGGKTRLQIQEMIKQKLIEGNYIQDPFVYVRFKNFKIFFLGADGGKSVTITNERCTFLEALALAGDLSVYTKRDRIAVLREENGRMVMHYMDPRSSEIFNDPYFLLKQNDFIITQSIKSKYYRDEVQYWMTWISLITSLASVATMVMVFVNSNK